MTTIDIPVDIASLVDELCRRSEGTEPLTIGDVEMADA